MSLFNSLKEQAKSVVNSAVDATKMAAKNTLDNAAEAHRLNKEAAVSLREDAHLRKQAHKKFKPRQKFGAT